MTRSLSPQFGSPEYHEQVGSGDHPPAMFATAREIVDTHHLSDQYRGIHNIGKPHMWRFKTKDDLLDFKAQNKPDLVENIKKEGFDWKAPITTQSVSSPESVLNLTTSPESVRNTGVVLEGHHRLAAMHRHRPDEFLPIETRA